MLGYHPMEEMCNSLTPGDLSRSLRASWQLHGCHHLWRCKPRPCWRVPAWLRRTCWTQVSLSANAREEHADQAGQMDRIRKPSKGVAVLVKITINGQDSTLITLIAFNCISGLWCICDALATTVAQWEPVEVEIRPYHLSKNRGRDLHHLRHSQDSQGHCRRWQQRRFPVVSP